MSNETVAEGTSLPSDDQLPPKTDLPVTSQPVGFQIAGFWRRAIASIIDGLVLGLPCFGLAAVLTFAAPWLGGWGRLLGLTLGTLYFGLLSSTVGGGRTLGKRIMKLAVVDANGQLVPLNRAILRGFVFNLILIANGWLIPVIGISPVVLAIQTYVLFVCGAITLYGFTFDRKTRRTLHDLLADTYVIKQPNEPGSHAPERAPIHRTIMVILASLGAVLVVGMVIASPLIFDSAQTVIMPGQNSSGPSINERLSSDPRFISVNVSNQVRTALLTSSPTPRVQQTFIVNIWYGGSCSNKECLEIIDGVARTVLVNYDGIRTFDGMTVSLMTRTDLGWGSYTQSVNNSLSIEDWEERLGIGS